MNRGEGTRLAGNKGGVAVNTCFSFSLSKSSEYAATSDFASTAEWEECDLATRVWELREEFPDVSSDQALAGVGVLLDDVVSGDEKLLPSSRPGNCCELPGESVRLLCGLDIALNLLDLAGDCKLGDCDLPRELEPLDCWRGGSGESFQIFGVRV